MTDTGKGFSDVRLGQYHCDFCRKDITGVVRIRCAVCTDFDLCLECFSCGAHVFPHRPDHDYRVISAVKTPIFSPIWGADEELLLLEGIEMCGFGNWSDIADHVGTKTKLQCEQHYEETYLLSATAPLPDPSKALVRRAKGEGNGEGDGAVTVKSEHIAPPASAPAPSRPPHGHAPSKPKPKGGLGQLVGYIPNRGDFDTEWENDAELTLADMEFKEEDTKWERELKLKVLDIYNSKLDARIERKKFILERGLLERKEKKRSKEEREVYNNMRVFARFHSAEEHEAFIQGLLNEIRLRKRIEQLQHYRLNGIRTLADAELYEAERRRREAAMGGKKATSMDAYTPYTKGGGKKRGPTEAAAGEDERGKKGKTESGTAAAASSSSSTSPSPSTSSTSDWDVSRMPGGDLLSSQERALCSTLRLLPQHYLMIKERLIRECFTRGFIKEHQAKQLIKIDINKTSKIFDFFVSVGWLNTQDALVHMQTKGNAHAQTNAHAQPTLNNQPTHSHSKQAAAAAIASSLNTNAALTSPVAAGRAALPTPPMSGNVNSSMPINIMPSPATSARPFPAQPASHSMQPAQHAHSQPHQALPHAANSMQMR